MRFTLAIAVGVLALALAGCGPAASTSGTGGATSSSNNNPAVTPQPAGGTQSGATTYGAITNPGEAIIVKNDLMQIGLAYHSCFDATGKGPAKVEDLYPYLEGAATPPAKGLASGKYKVYLNVNIAHPAGENANTVLGYYAGVPTAGGPVLMADASVRNMTADEFKNAPKAGK